jgi:glycosyltransferase involved in cell wall biosynthesis
MTIQKPTANLRYGVMQGDEKLSLICFSHLRWNFVFQRPQHLLTRAAKHFEVFFIEEPIFDDTCRAHLNVREPQDGVTVVTPMLPSGLRACESVMTQRRLIDMLIVNRKIKPSIGWYYTPMALQFTSHINFDCVVYDCMDELSNFKNAPSNMGELENVLLKNANIVFTGGPSLYESKRNKHNNIHAFPSSIDRAHFAKARASSTLNDPADQKAIPRPRIGYFGVIDERTDLALLSEVAERRSEYQFIILGPVVKIDPAILPRLPNIHWLGQKDYLDLPHYLAQWNAGFMPFALNDATRYISPTKTPEFLAAGLPVISTPVEDVVKTWGKPGLVAIASTAEQMCAEIDRALLVDHSLWLKRVDQTLATMSWDMTFAAMLALINEELPTQKTQLSNLVVVETILDDVHV